MTVSQLIDLLWAHEGDAELMFRSPSDRPLKLDEVWQPAAKTDVVILEFVEPE